MSSEKLDDNIKTFYERQNMNIPEVEKQYYFKDGEDVDFNSANSKVNEQLKLYKGFLVSEKIKNSTGGHVHQIIPQHSDPRNVEFRRAKMPQWEMDEKSSQDTCSGIYEKPMQRFVKSDLRRSGLADSKNSEKARLLDGYQDPSEYDYPKMIDLDDDDLVAPYAPVEKVMETPITVEESKKVEVPPQAPSAKSTTSTSRPAPTAQNFVIHKVKPNDTIEKLCLQYNVNKDVIRFANDFMGEEIYMFKELKIPYTYGKMYESFAKQDDEKIRKQFAIDWMNRTLKESYKKQDDFSKEAKYYLEVNDYDLDKAMREFGADLAFEKQVEKENKAFKRRHKRKQNVGVFSCFG